MNNFFKKKLLEHIIQEKLYSTWNKNGPKNFDGKEQRG